MNAKENVGTSQPASNERGPAWRAAEAAGIDMSLIELSLAKTPWERMLEHDAALAFAEQLRTAGQNYYAKSERLDSAVE